MKRKYTKKNNNYWNSLAKKSVVQIFEQNEETNPSMLGDPSYISSSSCFRNESARSGHKTYSTNKDIGLFSEGYGNLNALSAPFYYGKDGFANIKDPILLCQKAYFYVAIFRNTIDLMSELSDGDLSLSGGTKASRAFVKKWMETAKIDNIKSQFFREYYRSGNVFLYRMFAEFSSSEIAAMKTIYAKDMELVPQQVEFPKNNLPIRYIMLNPMDIVNYDSITNSKSYKKILTKFEALRLRNPNTDEEKKIYETVKKNNDLNSINLDTTEVYVDLDPNRLIFTFYKKQDYEPFGVPFGFPVLRDINWKLELKSVDQSLLKVYENILLLITMGNEPDKGGINPRHMQAMKDLFQNEKIGRVLVADYTTKAEFVIPKLESILGKQKYEIVNQDIKEGLQNIFFEEAKYSNSEVKIKVFLEKLKEGRKLFVSDFLQPEIKKICYAMGFRDFPKVRFKARNVLNESEVQKAVMRLIELGVLPPKQGMESLLQKEFPDSGEVEDGQAEYIKQRKEGFYSPLVGGPPLYQPPNAEKAPISNKTPLKNIPSANGRPKNEAISNEILSVKAISEAAKRASAFEASAENIVKKQKNIKKLTEEQLNVTRDLCNSVVESSEIEEWEDKFTKFCMGSLDISDLNIKTEILEICRDYDISSYEAALIYHSKKI